ncbi:MAG: hypothetical protein Q9162_007144 [Coniocarpon cinnabarinum]
MDGFYGNGYGGARADASDRYGGYTNGYTNGYHEDSAARRPGGYGGFGASDSSFRAGNHGASQRTPGPYSQRPQRRSPEASRGRNLSSSSAGPAASQIEDILRYIKREWGFMTEDKCIPVQVALQLLDPSSLGLASRAQEFRDVQDQLQSTLKSVVNEHHQDFNTAVGQFHQIQSSIQSSHQKVLELKTGLVMAKSNLLTGKPEYQNLITSSRNYADMLDRLHSIESIQNIPVRLEASMSDKRFLGAVDMLQEALHLVRKPELEDVGALSEMKVYLSNQEHSLTDILTEELHNHLYLKSPYCEERWQQYTRLATGSHLLSNNGTRQMYEFLDNLDTTTPLTDDNSRNPEADSFHYIHVIVEALTKLGRLSEAVDSIEERLPVELYKVVERSNNEIQQRYPNALRGDWKVEQKANELPSLNQTDLNVLRDLLDTLYAKFEAIAEAHRVFHDVAAGICKRQGNAQASEITRGFKELWKLYQSEMRSLLHDYLSTGGEPGQRSGQSSTNEGNVFRVQREKNKKCNFKMDLVDTQGSDLKPSREEIVTTWQKFVPGLVSLSQHDADTGLASMFGSAKIDTSAAGHKLLVRPSVFNISSLLPQSVTFLNRLKEIVPTDTDIPISTLTHFLNEFLINVFHPQLEDTLTDFCSQSFTQLDAFQQDPQWTHYSQKPIFRGTVKFYDIVTAFCRMLDDLTHDQLFTQLLITQMNTYHDKCSGWRKALVSRVQAEGDGRQVKAAAALAENKEVMKVIERVRSSSEQDLAKTLEVEHSLLHAMLPSRQLTEADLISDSKSQSQLCLLNTSMMWLSSKLKQLRRISERATDARQRRDSNMLPEQQSLTGNLTNQSNASTDTVFLPLNTESAGLFDGIVGAYQDLAEESLRTLHLEMRCQVFYRLGTSIRGSFLYADAAETPDEDVLTLSSDLLKFDRETKTLLRAKDHTFVVGGISRFVDSTFVHAIMNNVLSANEAGNDHFQLNSRVLYHNMSNIEPSSDLTRSFRFFELFEQGSEATLQAARQYRTGLTKDELRKLLELRASKDMESADREHALAAKRLLDDQLDRLDKIPKPSG